MHSTSGTVKIHTTFDWRYDFDLRDWQMHSTGGTVKIRTTFDWRYDLRDVCMHACMYVYVCICMHVCMYVYVCMFVMHACMSIMSIHYKVT